MGKSLVIVESPAKAKTINKYLGSRFIVKSSVGHIRDLPTSSAATGTASPSDRAKEAAKTKKMAPEEKAKYLAERTQTQLIARMGINPWKDWEANYQILPGKEKVIKELQKAAREAETIYLATDLDREGEAIAWHLQETIGGDSTRYKRVVFNEITKSAIQKAFEAPSSVDQDRVNAQQTRRFLDRLVGFMVSPLLWAKIARGLSAGRVQSVAVRLIVDREREIRAFIPEEYWEVHADLSHNKDAIRFEVVRENGKAFEPKNQDQAQSAVTALKTSQYEVIAREDKPTKTRPTPPYITSTLQQAASTRLGFGVKKTMTLAQRLYEAGFITYMRTDSTNISAEAIAGCRDYLLDRFGKKYLPETPNYYSSKQGAQEAHEAIRPSDVKIQAESLPDTLDRDARRLYELIWRQFLASQMPPADYISTTVTVKAGHFELKTKGRISVFDGFTRVQQPAGKKEEPTVLPDLKKGDTLGLIKLDPSQHFTKPVPRYSEASLVKELEKRGIGRPSTYAAIISTIQERGYVRVENKRFYSEKMGEIVTDRLVESFQDFLDFSFTARMEETLDDIATGKQNWKTILNQFFSELDEQVKAASDTESGMRGNKPTGTGIECPSCHLGEMQVRTASTGVFLGCSRYALPPKERCKHTINLIPADEWIVRDDEDAEVRELRSRHRCPICGTAMDSYLIDEKRKLHVCGNNPDCPGIEIENGQFKLKGYEGPTVECDKCHAPMQLKSGRFGKYFGCTNTECKNTRKILKNGEVAPPKMDPIPMPHLRCAKNDDHFILRDGATGLFLAASKFPKHRETRPPRIEELLSIKNQLDPKYHYLLSAPLTDPEGNPTIVRYSRKAKTCYVGSEKEGKPTSWRAFYKKGQWDSGAQE